MPSFTVANYSAIVSGDTYLQALFTSLQLATTTALLAVVLALPITMFVNGYLEHRMRLFLVFVLFLPFFSSYTIRMFAWQLWLNDSGILQFVLRQLGMLKGSWKLMYTQLSIQIGLLSILIPIATLIIYLSMSRMDKTLIPAAINLGASRSQAFWRITLPFSLPGIIVAFLFAFIITFGDFITPHVLGGNQVYTLSILIEDRIKINDWPTAAALGVIMLAILAVIIAVSAATLRLLPTAQNMVKQKETKQ